MQLRFVERVDGPERLVCDAEIVFDEAGPLEGMKLVGFAVWRGADGETYVTFPSRASGAGAERRFFDYLRSLAGSPKDTRRVKSWIVEEHRSWSDAGASATSTAEAAPARAAS